MTIEIPLNLIEPRFEDLHLEASRAASIEMFRYAMDLFDLLDILEFGYDCPRSKRAQGTIERCLDAKGRTTRVVAVRSFNRELDREIWLITHVGMTRKPR